jgi:hypothetical protein
MATVSGRLYYDAARTAAVGSNLGIANVPIVLQRISDGFAVAVLTSSVAGSVGSFAFANVPAGNFQVVEKYGFLFDDGTAPSSIGTVDWSSAVATTMINGGTCPPFKDESHVYVASPPPTATDLDCTVRNTWLETVGSANITNINILNGPVQYVPLSLTIDPTIIDSVNLVTVADNGTFGAFAAGTVANSGA